MLFINKFKIDLGQGDSIDIAFEDKENLTISDYIESLEEKNGWILLDWTAVNKNHIKRIEKLE